VPKMYPLILDRNLVVDVTEKSLPVSSLVGFPNPNLELDLLAETTAVSPSPVVVPIEEKADGVTLYLVLQVAETWRRELANRNFQYVRSFIAQPRNEAHRQQLLLYFQKIRAVRFVKKCRELMASYRSDERLIEMILKSCFSPSERPSKEDISEAICGMSRSAMYARVRKKTEVKSPAEEANPTAEQGDLLGEDVGKND